MSDNYSDDAYDDDTYDDGAYDDDAYDDDTYGEDDDGGWLGEGLIGLLLVAGVVLFLFPEPFTSTLGIVLLVIGVLAWAAEALM